MKKKNVALELLLKQYRGRVVFLCLLTLMLSLMQVFFALLTRFVIDSAIKGDGKLLFWGVVLVGTILAMVAVHSLLSWLTGSTVDKAAAALRQRLLRSAVYSRDLRLEQFHSGQLLSRGIEDVNAVCDGIITALPSLVGQIAQLTGAFVAVVLIAPKVALVLAGAALCIGVITALIRPVLKKHHRNVRNQDEKLLANMQEDLQQLELIQSLDVQENILDRFHTVQGKSLSAKHRRRRWTVGSGTVLNVGSLIGSGGLLLWGVGQVADQAISYGSLTSLIQLFALFRGPALGISGVWTRLTGVEVAAERLQNLLDYKEPEEACAVQLVKSIVFENVTFCYPGDEAPVLENFSAEFPVDGWTCLTGISGKGKTTMFKLILGLYAPQSGGVYLRCQEGNVPCSEATRHLFAYVPQDYALFSGTVLENLQLVTDGDEETRNKALRIAKAEFILEQSAGEQTLLGENNTGLSKGQLQRLAIARAILMERPILLLDECTSALDAETEQAVLQGLHQMGKQAILVTHRPEALQGLENIEFMGI